MGRFFLVLPKKVGSIRMGWAFPASEDLAQSRD